MPPIELVGGTLTLLGTFGGIWAILGMFKKFQTDFNDRYREELEAERKKRAEAERALEDEREQRMAAELEAARRGRLLAANGIPFVGAPKEQDGPHA